MVGAFLIHYEANVSPRRGNAEQVGRGYKFLVMILTMMSPLLQLVGVFDEAVLKRNGVVSRGGG